jgi:hypothetical protein
MRMKLTESPAFAAMKEEGQASKAPYAEAFGQWKNLKLVILAFASMMCAQGAVWYTAFFYIQTFMEKFLKVDAGDHQRPDDDRHGDQRGVLRRVRLAVGQGSAASR